MTAREQILGSIRSSKDAAAHTTDWATLPRSYRRSALVDRGGVLDLFAERLHDYDATVTRCRPDSVTATVSRLLTQLGMRRVGVPAGIDYALPQGPVELVIDDGLSYEQLNNCDGVLTRCTLGIAETGTIVLQSGPGQGRRALTLVPDVHICIVRYNQVVATVPEAFDGLGPTSHLPTTFISGPSATADIEMTRVKGVHGPRFLHVVLVEDEAVDIQQHQGE